MAVDDQTPEYAFAGFDAAAVAKRQPSDALGRYFHNPYGAGEWRMYAINRRLGRKILLNEFVESADWTDSLVDVVTQGTASFDNAKDPLSGARISDIIQKGSELRLQVPNPISGKWEEKDRFIVFDRTRGSDSSLNVTFFNHFKYLVDSEVTVLYTKGKRKRDWTVREITVDLLKKYKIPVSVLPKMVKSSRKVPYFYQETESLLDILLRLWTMEAKASGRKFVMRMWQGKLQITTKPKNPKGKVVEVSNEVHDGGMLIDASTTDDINGTKTVVRLWGTSKEFSDTAADARNAIVKSKQYASKAGVAQWGRIYYEAPVDGITTQSAINKRAQAVLKQKSSSHFTGSITIIGYPWLKTGDAIRMNDEASGAVGLFWLKTTRHSINGGGEYTMSSDITRYDYTKELKTEATDLNPDSSLGGGIGGGAVPGSKTNAIPKDVWQTIALAAGEAGVPSDWANSKALEKLLQGESGFRWTAQNPSSTAYGLFQFLDSTWAGVGITKAQATVGAKMGGKTTVTIGGVTVAYWKYAMCVAGLRYIKNRYKTPEQAWAFWQSKSPHWY